MDSLLKHIEENLHDDELNQEVSCLNEFRDEDLAMYPAIETKEEDLTAQQCETIVNNVINAISLAEEESSVDKPVRALIALAYNSLMDIARPIDTGSSASEKPLFHKDNLKLSEIWLRVCAESDLCLSDYLSIETRLGNPLEVKLTRPDASDFERKASIGAWAYYHLRLMGNFKGSFWSPETADRFPAIIRQLYGFDLAYEFPVFSKASYALISDRLLANKSGEALYLLYRSMIIVENAKRYNINEQWKLLEQLVFGHPKGLRDGRLWLWNWTNAAAGSKNLKIPIEQLLNDLEWVLTELDREDPGYVKFTSIPRRNLSNFREFYQKYVKGAPRKSKYFKYARLVNDYYFYSLKLASNRELVCALIYIVEKTSNRVIQIKPSRPPWKRWGEEMGAKICRKHASSSRQNDLVDRIGRISVHGDNWRSRPASRQQVRLRPVSVKQPTPATNSKQRSPVVARQTLPQLAQPKQPKTPNPPKQPTPSSSGEPECPICLIAFTNRGREGHKIVVAGCGHIYCDPCLRESIAALGREYPRCRKTTGRDIIEK